MAQSTITNLRRDIRRAKAALISKANRLQSIWENFGQNEVRKLNQKYIDPCWSELYRNHDEWMQAITIVNNFNDWCSNVTYYELKAE